MTSIHDGRKSGRHRQQTNRAKFIQRHKEAIKDDLNKQIVDKDIKDIIKNPGVIIKSDEEPQITYDGHTDVIFQGNKQFREGDHVYIPKESVGGKGANGGAGGGEGEDEFKFYLTVEEFYDLLFDDLELPNFLKKSLKQETLITRKTGGYTKSGIPARLSLKKTFEAAIARKIANKSSTHKSPFLIEEDLRYIRKYIVEEPYYSAVMFCVLDVSGSMQEWHKLMAKKFFIFLYVFLSKYYKHIDIVFIKHHDSAFEVDEKDFFYSRDTGGTDFTSAFTLVNDIINSRYDLSSYNVYVAQVSDGGYWETDIRNRLHKILNTLVPKLQYMTYCEVNKQGDAGGQSLLSRYVDDPAYACLTDDKFGGAVVNSNADLLKAFYNLFKKKELVR